MGPHLHIFQCIQGDWGQYEPFGRNNAHSVAHARTLQARESLLAYRPQLASSSFLVRGGQFTPCALASIFLSSYRTSYKLCGPTRGHCISAHYSFDGSTKGYGPGIRAQGAEPK